ncbi:hypothetical protein B0H21DRAFT_561782 [Amylocystis lapponica]|nr:hypothetical protein B0H21DRAFT_561782 [Amylocystis lapponica]
MYDYPAPAVASPPSPPPSPHKLSHSLHHHRRSHSPIPHIATLLPHHAHSQYSPATRASDISRLLDPAYASSSSSGSGSSGASPTHAQTRAYVDHRGDLHDPDYRDFPVLRPTARSRQMNRHRRTSSGTARSRSTSRGGDHYSTYSMARPGWERDWSTENEDEEEAMLEDDDDESQSHHSPFATHQHARKSVPAPTYAHPAHVSPYSHFFGETVPMASSPPGSLEESPLHSADSPFRDETESDAFEEEPKARRSCSMTMRFSRDVSAPPLPPREEQPEKDDDTESTRIPNEQFTYHAEDLDFASPSCTYSIRQQWMAVLLRMRFSVFHAKRRLFRRRHST